MTRRFFIEAAIGMGQNFTLTRQQYPDEWKHIYKVLRLQPGDNLELVNGQGIFAEAEILNSSANSIELAIRDIRKAEAPKPRILLAQALLKGQRMDWIIEKATELGASEFIAVATEYSVLSEQDAANRGDRWQRLARSALKQSASPFVPKIIGPVACLEFLNNLPAGAAKIFLHPEPGTPPLLHVLQHLAGAKNSLPQDLCIFVGPEGGFHPKEVLELQKEGFLPASLGDSILRGETAGLVALAVAKAWAIAHNYS